MERNSKSTIEPVRNSFTERDFSSGALALRFLAVLSATSLMGCGQQDSDVLQTKDSETGGTGNDSTGTGGTDPMEPCDPSLAPRSNLPPIDLGSERVLEVSNGALHACALLSEGSVKCWGGNGRGALGKGNGEDIGDEPGEMGDALLPVDLGTDADGKPLKAQAVSAAEQYTCALLSEGSVKCWGVGVVGMLGQGSREDIGDEPGEMGDALPPVDLGTDEDGRPLKAVAVSTSFTHTCALLSEGSVKCWGFNVFGELGQGNDETIGDEPGEMGNALQPVDLGTDADGNPLKAQAVSSGEDYTCALLSEGSVKCWGGGDRGVLGQGNKENIGDGPNEMGNALQPVDLGIDADGNPLKAMAISGGGSHVCALLSEGSVKCWGGGFGGVLGQGNEENIGDGPNEMGNALRPVDLGTDKNGSPVKAQTISVGTTFNCAMLSVGSLKCWGRGDGGVLGRGNEEHIGDEPGEMASLEPVAFGECGTVEAVSVGPRQACVRLSEGSVKCWGQNSFGALGQGNTEHIGDDPEELPF